MLAYSLFRTQFIFTASYGAAAHSPSNLESCNWLRDFPRQVLVENLKKKASSMLYAVRSI